MSHDPQDPHEGAEPPHEERRRGPSLRGAARRLVGESAPKTKELLTAVLNSSDKVKTDAVRQVGREVRTYLEGLGLDDAIHHLLTNYSLEVKASISLKPLAGKEEEHEKERSRRERRRRRLREEAPPEPDEAERETEEGS